MGSWFCRLGLWVHGLSSWVLLLGFATRFMGLLLEFAAYVHGFVASCFCFDLSGCSWFLF